jgi:Tfp pilus assembly protein FimV
MLMVTCVVAVTVGAQAALRPLVASPGGGASAAPGVTQSVDGYVVAPGDTLWSIAAALAPAGTDVRATVDGLARANGGPGLVVGQRLALPD